MHVLIVHAKLQSDTEQLLIVNVHRTRFSQQSCLVAAHSPSLMSGLSPSLIIAGFLHSLTSALIIPMLSCKKQIAFTLYGDKQLLLPLRIRPAVLNKHSTGTLPGLIAR